METLFLFNNKETLLDVKLILVALLWVSPGKHPLEKWERRRIDGGFILTTRKKMGLGGLEH